MKRRWFLIAILLFSATLLRAQYARPLKETKTICHNNSSFCVGVTGSFSANDMLYTAVDKSLLRPLYAPTIGLAAEWNTMQRVSIGMDLSYARRGTRKAFSTELLTSYSTTTHAHVDYTLSMNALELRVPITLWIGYDETVRPYLFVAPRLDLWLGGNAKWVRWYENDSYQPLTYTCELTDAIITPYDVSAVGGFGVGSRFFIGRTRFFVKFELSYGISIINNFPQKDDQTAVTVEGWGDLSQESFGERYLQNVEARLILLIPLRRHLRDACAIMP